MSRLCIGFEVHQPFRLRPGFTPSNGNKGGDESLYFSPKNREILERVADKCYIPATRIILDSLDAGFKCAFSLSGTVVEQLEKWRPDALELFREVAAHRNVEMLAQTYYHSIASLFDRREFEEQVRLHMRLMKDTFGATPKVLENTEFIFNNGIARSAKKLGFKAVYTEGVERVLGWRSPDFVYACNGMKLLLRNYHLSDDIAFRFNDHGWDQYPLMADKFASWIADSPGDCANVFVDYETFGEHHWKDTGILEFLRWIPVECDNKGVEMVMPSEAASLPARDELDVEETISWADVEKDASAWTGSRVQQTALKALQRARAYAKDKTMWRYLQTSDHFYYMASKNGACGEVHGYFSPDACDPSESFTTYMGILSHFERKAAGRMKTKAAAMKLRTVTVEEAFKFNAPGGHVAYCLDDICDLIWHVPEECVNGHIENGDFTRWAGDVLGDKALAKAISKCRDRLQMARLVTKKRDELWASLKKPSR